MKVAVDDIEARPVVTEVKDVTILYGLENIRGDFPAGAHPIGVLNVYRTYDYAPTTVCHDDWIKIIPAWLCICAFGGALYFAVKYNN